MSSDFKPVAAGDRIQALDVVRGFALLGIFLMNIEWFNRPILELGSGIDPDLTGMDFVAGWLVHTFVASKFWVMFSLLFGMGFAVMLQRAQDKGVAFLRTYGRRTLALALFGALHWILLWPGDILFAYSMGTAALLLMLFGRPKHWLILAALFLGVSFLPGLKSAGALLALLMFSGVMALFLRDDGHFKHAFATWPRVAAVIFVLGVIAVVGGGVLFAFGKVQEGASTASAGLVFATSGWLAQRYHEPKEARPWRIGAAIYLLPGFMALAGAIGAVMAPASSTSATPATQAASMRGAAVKQAAGSQVDAKQADQRAKQIAQGEKQRAERKARAAEERRVMTSNDYVDAVRFRAQEFAGKALGESGLSAIALGVFTLGFWFIKAGVIQHPQRHLPLFRRLAVGGMAIGGALTIASSLLATHKIEQPVAAGLNSVWMFSQAIHILGALPLMLGYVGCLVLALQTGIGARVLGWLAPAGRMALTNYISQTVICSLVFYGYGLGHWGMPRAQQVLFVFTIFAIQVMVSRLWLSSFRYGPLEWLWRWATYGTRPAMRLTGT